MKIVRATSLLLGVLTLGGCALLSKAQTEPTKSPAMDHRAESLMIPPGQLPPPGQCRIWLPDTPPGRQSPASTCESLRRQVPAGGWLVYRAEDNAKEVAVSVYRSRWPRVVSETRYFDYWTGRLVRVEN